MAVASLDVTKTYADNTTLTEAQLDSAFESVENYTQNSVVNNLNQLKADIFPAGYDYDNDGSGNLTHTIYNKQSASVAYSSDVLLGVTVSSTLVTTSSSLNLAFTPAATGKYFVQYDFTIRQFTDGRDFEAVYALYDITNSATLIAKNVRQLGNAAITQLIQNHPVTLSYMYNFSSTAAATFGLYYAVTANSGTPTSHRIECNATFKQIIYGHIHKI